MQSNRVPATPSVIAWAIRESGFSIPALATLLKVPADEIEGWTRGVQPEHAKLQAFAHEVKRPFSAFLLPAPPADPLPAVKFRSTSASKRRDLIPEERRRIREATRLQRIITWMAPELHLRRPDIPQATTKEDPEKVALAIRKRLGVSLETQFSWSSALEALRAWREKAEDIGITVLMLPMGEESCRGFSIWDDVAPIIAINTAWVPEARLFTLIHEMAHLSSRTNSACAEDVEGRSNAGDRIERWCDRVAAAVLVPVAGLAEFVADTREKNQPGGDLATASRIAARFKVSRRAAALRLIEHKLATWSLFRSIPPHRERQESGGGGTGRTRAQRRRDWYGQRTIRLFREALSRDVVGAGEVVDYLGLSPDALMASATPGEPRR
jgi:Zn-dependent peptidase ImmA (M78 family)